MKRIATMIFAAVSIAACDAPPDDHDRSGDVDIEDIQGEAPGDMWGPCLFDDAYGGPELNGWGCDGGIEGGLACAKPVNSGSYLSVCVPLNEGGCAVAPFGTGFATTAYCVPTCDAVDDCEAGMECSGNGMCAWGES